MDSRSYRFISDPDHKENLSGRVRVACLTCRRKKIKCDGEVPCQTCKEKGVRCEGLTERKRPSKPADRQESLDASSRSCSIDFSTDPARKKQAQDTSHPRRTAAHANNLSKRPEVVRVDTLSSKSSISSGQQSQPSEWAESVDPLQQIVRAPTGTYANQVNISPFNVGGINWNLGTGQSMNSYTGSDMRSNDTTFSIQLTNEPEKWQERVDSVSWSPENFQNQDASDLLSTTKMLEAHAQSLRRLASEQHAQHFDDVRRQTVTLPLQSNVYNEFDGPSSEPKGAFDDMTMVMGRRSSNSTNSAFTAAASDPNAWLDQQYSLWKAPRHSGS